MDITMPRRGVLVGLTGQLNRLLVDGFISVLLRHQFIRGSSREGHCNRGESGSRTGDFLRAGGWSVRGGAEEAFLRSEVNNPTVR